MNQGWEKPECCKEYHYFEKGVSLCGSYFGGMWPMPPHDLNHPENCERCVLCVRAGNTELKNPFGPRPWDPKPKNPKTKKRR